MTQKLSDILVSLVLLLPLCSNLSAQSNKGVLTGRIIDQATRQPIAAANVIVVDTDYGASTGENGNFRINNIPVGNYILELRHIGYEPHLVTDVIVRPGRITTINSELVETSVQMEAVIVTPSYFTETDNSRVSGASFSGEEIRRSPGSAGDISRILNAVPGVTQQTDQFNDLMVRDGSPMENGFYLDNIPIPNINHFPVLGSAAGAIGILNTDFIDKVDFYAGGFSASYGGRLSSIMDISYREGNREEIDVQLDLNMSGFGVQAEGPLLGGKGAWLLSGRRSYLDIIQDAIQTEGETPRFGDVQAKLTYDLNPKNMLTMLLIFAPSSRESDQAFAVDKGFDTYQKKWRASQNTIGFNWRSLWSKRGYSKTSFSISQTTGDDVQLDVITNAEKVNNSYKETFLTFRNFNYLKMSGHAALTFGTELKYARSDYDFFMAADTNEIAETVPALTADIEFNSISPSTFATLTLTPTDALTADLGMRMDYSSLNKSLKLSPRVSLNYAVSDKLQLTGAVGAFYQDVPLFILAQDKANETLPNLRAMHYIIGASYMIRPDTKLSLEFYQKDYDNFPVDPDNPYSFIVDLGTNYAQSNTNYGVLEPAGKSYARGIDLLLRKKLADKVYGMVSASYYVSRYKTLDKTWHSRAFDNRFLFNIIGGYKPNKLWEMSVRWSFTGGTPYTPYDIAESQRLNTGIIDISRFNSERLPAYHSLRLRADRRFHFKNSYILLYLDIWNIYNRKNVALRLWNKTENKQDEVYMWSFLPILGVEYEF